MKKRTSFIVISMLAMCLSIVMSSSCKKEDKDDDPIVPTTPATTVKDVDGNVYQTITIGSQVWMLENLKVTKYRNGDSIPNITDGVAWSNCMTGACCNYDNNVNNGATYGRLYNWIAVNDSRKICPTGWHVPVDAEWTTLINVLGGDSVAGGKMKESGTAHWNYPNTGGTNESGFKALSTGGRSTDGTYGYIGEYCAYWCASDPNTTSTWLRYLRCDMSDIGRANDSPVLGFSVRCLKD